VIMPVRFKSVLNLEIKIRPASRSAFKRFFPPISLRRVRVLIFAGAKPACFRCAQADLQFFPLSRIERCLHPLEYFLTKKARYSNLMKSFQDKGLEETGG
jgi:hypothetical protein